MSVSAQALESAFGFLLQGSTCSGWSSVGGCRCKHRTVRLYTPFKTVSRYFSARPTAGCNGLRKHLRGKRECLPGRDRLALLRRGVQRWGRGGRQQGVMVPMDPACSSQRWSQWEGIPSNSSPENSASYTAMDTVLIESQLNKIWSVTHFFLIS